MTLFETMRAHEKSCETAEPIAALYAASMAWRDPRFEELRVEWDRAVGDYMIAQARLLAMQELGPLALAAEALDALTGKEREDAFAAYQVKEEAFTTQYCRDFWNAGHRLASIPAPDPFALRLKAHVMITNNMDNDGSFEGDPFEIIEADAARLLGKTG